MNLRPLEDTIAEKIRQEKAISFADFMEMALYYPALGYYTSGVERVGAQGDFYTSPATHPVFGALLARWLEGAWRHLGQPSLFTVVEMGAGKGLLRQDILHYVERLNPRFGRALHYVTVERGQGNSTLPQGVTGCLLSNELLDAFPVHRVLRHQGQLKEIYVTLEDGAWTEVALEPSTPLLQRQLEESGLVLEEGCQVEVCLQIAPWMEEVSRALDCGLVLTIDYGYLGAAFSSSQHPQGTLFCYYRHRPETNPYQRLGEQDITAQVDFSPVLREGERWGLRSLAFTTQRRFLLDLGMGRFQKALSQARLPSAVRYANQLALQELIKPGEMGDFKVLVQSKGVKMASPWWPEEKGQEELCASLPLLGEEHTPLLRARYPHLAWDESERWF